MLLSRPTILLAVAALKSPDVDVTAQPLTLGSMASRRHPYIVLVVTGEGSAVQTNEACVDASLASGDGVSQ